MFTLVELECFKMPLSPNPFSHLINPKQYLSA